MKTEKQIKKQIKEIKRRKKKILLRSETSYEEYSSLTERIITLQWVLDK